MGRLLFWIALAPLAFGQLDSNSITISATRTAVLLPDRVSFGLNVSASMDISYADILGALKDAGIPDVTLNSVSVVETGNLGPVRPAALQWVFVSSAPLTKLTDSLRALGNAQTALRRRGITLDFSIQGSQTSPQQLDARRCSLADLVGDARAQAGRVASAAGVTVGPILAVYDAGSANPAGGAITGALSQFLIGILPETTACSIVVQFQMLRY